MIAGTCLRTQVYSCTYSVPLVMPNALVGTCTAKTRLQATCRQDNDYCPAGNSTCRTLYPTQQANGHLYFISFCPRHPTTLSMLGTDNQTSVIPIPSNIRNQISAVLPSRACAKPRPRARASAALQVWLGLGVAAPRYLSTVQPAVLPAVLSAVLSAVQSAVQLSSTSARVLKWADTVGSLCWSTFGPCPGPVLVRPLPDTVRCSLFAAVFKTKRHNIPVP